MLLRRIAGFGFIPVLGALTPLLVIPSLTRELGSTAWASLAIGQSMGIFALTATSSGWTTLGSRIQHSYAGSVSDLFLTSVLARFFYFVLFCAVASAATYFIAPSEHSAAAALMVPAIAVWGLGPVWLLVVRGHPGKIAAWDTVPKLMASICTVLVLHAYASAFVYPVILLAVGATLIVLSTLHYSKGAKRIDAAAALRMSRDQFSLTSSRLASGSFTSLATPIVAIVAPTSVAVFAAMDRLRLMASQAIAAIAAALISWVYDDGVPVRARQLKALLLMSLAGVLVSSALLLTATLGSSFLFSDAIIIPPSVAALHCLAIILIGIGSSLTFHHLAPLGDSLGISASAYAGAAVGVPSLVVLAGAWGSVGGSVAILLSEFVVSAVLVVRTWRRRPGTKPVG